MQKFLSNYDVERILKMHRGEETQNDDTNNSQSAFTLFEKLQFEQRLELIKKGVFL